MNWVGGKLQRHAKAKANDQKRAQKQDFAKARQRLHHERPPISPPALAHYQDSKSRPISKSSSDGQPHHRRVKVDSATLPSPSNDQAEPNSIAANPLERVKRRLLGKGDWASVSVARPVQMNFASTTEMQQIGRPKKIQKLAPRQKAARVPTLLQQERHIRGLASGRSRNGHSSLGKKDCSIRIGSSIHRTQTTGRTNPQPSFPSDPMLLDGKEEPIMRKVSDIEEVYLEQDLSGDNLPDSVPSLEQVRDLRSFDEVKDRSSSIVRQASETSNPFVTQTNNIKSALVKGQDVVSSAVDEEQHRENQLTAAQVQFSRTASHGEEASFGFRSASTKRSTKFASTTTSSPRFTIDHQVLLERQLQSSTAPVPSSRSHSVSLPPVPEEIPDDLQRQNNLQSSCFDACDDPMRGFYKSTEQLERPAKRRRILPASESAHSSFGPAEYSSRHSTTLARAGSTPLSLRDRFTQAKQNQEQSCRQTGPHISQHGRISSNSISDENEAWMKYVFPKDFSRILKDFTFHPPAPKHLASGDRQRNPLPSSLPCRGFADPTEHLRRSTSDTSIATDVNGPMVLQGVDPEAQQTETDFLSKFSPMEGVFDERLGPISMYTNVAHTDQSFISTPSARGGSVQSPLSAGSFAQYDFGRPMHRRALYPLRQPVLWQSQVMGSLGHASSNAGTKCNSPLWTVTSSHRMNSSAGNATPIFENVWNRYHASAREDIAPAMAHARHSQEGVSSATDDWSTLNVVGGSRNSASYHDGEFQKSVWQL